MRIRNVLKIFRIFKRKSKKPSELIKYSKAKIKENPESLINKETILREMKEVIYQIRVLLIPDNLKTEILTKLIQLRKAVEVSLDTPFFDIEGSVEFEEWSTAFDKLMDSAEDYFENEKKQEKDPSNFLTIDVSKHRTKEN